MKSAGKLEEYYNEKYLNYCYSRLSQFMAFEGLNDSIKKDSKLWEEYFNADSPQTMKLPKQWEKLSEFHMILILRCFRPDKLVPAIQSFVNCKNNETF